MGRIVEILETLPPAPTCQHVLGNGMRLDADKSVRLDERWRTELSREQLAIFDETAGRLNARLGYR